MVAYIKSDLEFILAQIKISEAHAGGQPLFGPGGLIPTYNISAGLRTVDGSYNNLLHPLWGASDQPFNELVTPVYRPASATSIDMNGQAPGGVVPTAPTYAPSNNPNNIVIDSTLRTISNLIVDQTLANPAAIIVALERAGVPGDHLAIAAQIKALFGPIENLFLALDAATVVSTAATAAAAANPGDQALADAAAAAAQAVVNAQASLDGASGALNAALDANGIVMDGNNVSIPNVAPDEGLSAPFNSWFTLFGQFFDHGLDLVNKGGSGTVFIPLQPDDPLYDPTSPTNFMVLTRATTAPGADGVFGTPDDVKPINHTTSFVDQNQTYTSHASHQVFVRQYELNAAGDPVATGKLIQGSQGGGMATWADVKAQTASLLGIQLVDTDVGSVPLIVTDQYGEFIRGPNGYPMIMTSVGMIEGNPAANGGLGVLLDDPAAIPPYTAMRTGHAFLADIAHNAVPDGLADGDIEVGGNIPADGTYDDELLDAHYIAGDGRVNENVGLTAVHHVFHSEHNRLADHTKQVVLSDAQAMIAGGATQAAAVAFLNEWLINDVATVPATATGLVWDGERIFQAAKFGTEMQYQHLVFEEFARKVQPNINVFLVPDGFDATIDPTIVAEFAHVVYRFGHSMLTESIDRFDPNFNANHIGLIEGFLNPIQFNQNGGTTGVDHEVSAGAIIRGMTRQVGNSIDEFVTTALRNNLLGLPLDLATINLARGRDTGVPSLNAARRDFYEATNQEALLKPYESWVDFAGHLKHEASIINFVASYGTHSLITSQVTIEGKRDAALTLITGVAVGDIVIADPATFEADRLDFLNATGAYAGGTLGGLENVDLWIGGLAEETMPFGGMLGSTFNFVFEVQMESLQNGDRFYYLQRLDGLHLFSEMEANSFAAMIMRNTDATHLPSDVFSTPGLILEIDRTKQYNDGLGETAGADGILNDDPLTAVNESADNLGNDPSGGGILTPLVIRNNPATAGADTNYLRYTGGDHVVLGGTDPGNAFNPSGIDILIGGIGDDTLFGDGGADRLEGGFGNDIINGGDGDDIIRDSGGDDNIKGGAGNDTIHAGQGLDLVLGGDGNDFIILGTDMGSEVFGGVGNDFILGNKNAERILGNEGDDWLETGTFDGAPGDNFDEIFAQDGIDGHDVFLGDGGFDEFIGEGGDDIMVGSLGRGKMAGMSGFDWATYKDMDAGVNADLSIPIVFDEAPVLPQNAALDEFESMEGLSGSAFDDVLSGTNDVAADRASLANGGTTGYLGSVLDAQGIASIAGLQAVLGTGVTSFAAGDIILGGDGSDVIRGNAGDDIIDGDKWLDVQIGVFNGPNGTGGLIKSVDSMTELTTDMFNGVYNAGQLQIVRSIKTADGTGDTDVAVFADIRANYTVATNPNGTITVTHVTVSDGLESDGTDTLRNIERLRFSDVEIDVPLPPTDIQWNGVTPASQTDLPGANTVIANLSTSDPNGAGNFTYTLVTQSSANFALNANTGALSRTTGGMADNTLYTFGIRSTDDTGLSRLETFDVRTGTTGNNTLTADADDTALYGRSGNDTLNGGTGNDNLFGQDGNDTLNGNGGNDILVGGDDNDIIDGGAGNDTIRYTFGDDADTVNGGADFDTLQIIGTTGGDTLDVSFDGTSITAFEGGTVIGVEAVRADLDGGTDTLAYAAASAAVTVNLADGTASGFAGIAGIDNVSGGGGADTIIGNGDNNALNGGGGSDTLEGGAGQDALNGGAGNDTIRGGQNSDSITQLATDGRDIVDGGTTGAGAVDTSSDTYILNGIAGTAETFRIYTRAAATTAGITGLAANTEIVVTRNGTNNASVIAELDNIEEITVNALNVTANDGGGLNGGNNSGDVVQVIGNFNSPNTSLNFSTITVNGGLGDDTVDISQLESSHRIVFNSNGGDDTVIGAVRSQDLINFDDVIDGTDGNDYLNGGLGNDIINGGAGDDVIKAGYGNDTYNGGEGSDTLDYSFANALWVNLKTGELGDIGNPAVAEHFTSIENFIGGASGDIIIGSDVANRLEGGGGDDVISGGGGDDIINAVSA